MVRNYNTAYIGGHHPTNSRLNFLLKKTTIKISNYKRVKLTVKFFLYKNISLKFQKSKMEFILFFSTQF